MERVSAQWCCIPYTVIEIFDCNCNDLELGRFKVIQGQRSWSQSKAHGWFPILPSLSPTSYLAPYWRYLMRKCCDLDLGRFKVIKGQRSWSHATTMPDHHHNSYTERDPSVSLRLRHSKVYPIPLVRTKRYCSFINYSLKYYQ